MTQRPDDPRWSDEEIARRLRDLPAVDANASFRRRLRESFVSGNIASSRAGRPAPSRRVATWPVAVGLAVAAAAAFFLLTTPRLELLDVSGSGVVRVGGREFGTEARQDLERALRGGAEVQVGPGVTLDLQVPRTAIYELTAGTRMQLPPAPGRWLRRAVACSLTTGEIRLKTGSRFSGARLTVHTPDGIVIVTGTLLSVVVDAEGTCVCVLEGAADVGVNATQLETVTPGLRKIILKNGEASIVPLKPMHSDGVLDFQKRLGGRLE